MTTNEEKITMVMEDDLRQAIREVIVAKAEQHSLNMVKAMDLLIDDWDGAEIYEEHLTKCAIGPH